MSVKFISDAFTDPEASWGGWRLGRRRLCYAFVYLWRSHCWVGEFTKMYFKCYCEICLLWGNLDDLPSDWDEIIKVIWNWNSAFYLFGISSVNHLYLPLLSSHCLCMIWSIIQKEKWLCSNIYYSYAHGLLKLFTSLLTYFIWILLDN